MGFVPPHKLPTAPPQNLSFNALFPVGFRWDFGLQGTADPDRPQGSAPWGSAPIPDVFSHAGSVSLRHSGEPRGPAQVAGRERGQRRARGWHRARGHKSLPGHPKGSAKLRSLQEKLREQRDFKGKGGPGMWGRGDPDFQPALIQGCHIWGIPEDLGCSGHGFVPTGTAGPLSCGEFRVGYAGNCSGMGEPEGHKPGVAPKNPLGWETEGKQGKRGKPTSQDVPSARKTLPKEFPSPLCQPRVGAVLEKA